MKSHKEVPECTRDRIVEYMNELEGIAAAVNEIKYPNEPISPIPRLPVFHDGFSCQWSDRNGRRCAYVCRGQDPSGIQRHCKRAHGWRNWQERGGRAGDRQRQTPNRLWIDGQHCQRLFKTGKWERYFIVATTPTSPVPEIQDKTAQAQTVFAQYKCAIKEAKAARSVEEDSNRVVPNAWLSFTGWAGHLSKFQSKEQVHAYIRGPGEDDDEDGLEDACRGMRRLIRAAFSKCRPEIVSKAALESVNRRETGADSNERPFYAGQQVKTIRKYSDSFVHILRYWWRTARQEERPKYEMTERQMSWMQRLQDVAAPEQVGHEVETPLRSRAQRKEERRKAIEDACLMLWIAMFDHELKDNEFESGIISGLAVLGIDSQTGDWKSALSYTPILSAIVAVARALVVYRAWQMRQHNVHNALERGSTEEEAKSEAPSVVEGVDRLVQRFMTLREFGGRISPMDRILRTRTYGLKIRMTTKAGGTVAWEGNNVLVNKVRFGMDDIRSVVHGLFDTVRGRLKDLLFVDDTHQLPTVDIKSLADNAAEMSEDWNFLQDGRNQWSVNGERWMWDRMFVEERLERRFIEGTLDDVQGRNDIHWNMKNVEDYFRQVRRFKEECAVLVHMTAGSPARATELISIQIKNGPDGRGQRGIFIDNGMVDFVTSYHKGWSASKKSKIIHRYVPREVGEVIVYSMWLLEPWVEQLQNMTNGQTDFGPFMWEPEPEKGWKVGEDGDEGLEDDGGNVSGGEQDDEWSDNEMDGPLPAQPRNIDGFWDTDRVRRVMQRETRKRIGVGIGVSDWRHAYPAIQREFTTEQSVREALDCIYDNRAPQIRRMEDAIAEQAGHSRYMEDMIYGLLLTESPTATMSERNMFRKVSIDWHRFLRFASAWEQQSVDPIVQRHMEAERTRAAMWRWKQMREVDVEIQAKRLYGSNATFRGVQKPALDAIISGAPRVLVVMRTGGGKSWLFMLPAAGSVDGVTIVIVPTISLRQDFMDRCNRDGISCAGWDGSRPPYHARIILVVPESAVSQSFGRFIDEKRTMHQLERIVYDECHTILESTADWRPKVLELCRMTEKGVQVVFLTATLPPSKEPAFFDAVGVPENDVSIFRDDTSRPNVGYSVVEYGRDDEDEAVRRLVEMKKRQYPAPGQIIVYCKKVEQARRLAKVLQCSVYHRTVGGSEEKKSILRRLTGQQERVFTATNALGLGVDAPTIRAVIHVGIRESLAQYAQESGRAGRDGLESEAIIMRARWCDKNGQSKSEQGWRAEAATKAFLAGGSCRRIALDKHMDGRPDRLGCEIGEERCDICRGQPRGTKRRRIVVQDGDEQDDATRKMRAADEEAHRKQTHEGERFQEEQRQYRRMEEQRRRETIDREDGVEQLRKHFESWKGRCTICHVRGRDEEDHTDWRECPHSDTDRNVTQKTWDWLGEIRFEAYSQCWSCWAAQAVCHSWEDVSHSGPQRFRRKGTGWMCQFAGLLRDVAAGVLGIGHTEVVGDWMDEEMKKAGEEGKEGQTDWEKRKGWMGKKVRIGGMEMSGLCQMFWELGESG